LGKSIFGKRSSPRPKYENNPTTLRIRTMTLAKTGRLTQIAANHCMDFRFALGYVGSGDGFDLSAVAEFVDRVDRDFVRGRERALDLGEAVQLATDGHDPLRDAVADAHEDARGAA